VSDKEPTSKGRLDDTGDEANGKRRRRRRGGGLRVPSDMVPRASNHRDLEIGEPPEPPSPEAPELAVSVAAAFGDDGDAASAREASADAHVEEQERESAREISDRAAKPEEAPTSDGAVEAEGDRDPEGPGDQESDDATEGPQRHVAAEGGAEVQHGERGVAAAPPAGDDEKAVADDDGEVGGPDASIDDSSEASPVDIPIEEEVPVRRPHRAQTEALTEEDLEELMEPIEDDDEVAPADSSASDSARDDDEVDFDAQETAQFVPVVIDEEPGDDGEARAAASRAAASGVTILARREVGGDGAAQTEPRNPPHDPGDSAEMLSDELIEEIDDAAPSDVADQETSDPGARSSHATEVLDAEEVEALSEKAREEEAARSADPPPVPGEPTSKPPPAPSFAQVTKGRTGAHGKAWFDEIFDEDYLRTLPFLTPQATQAEAKFVAEAIAASAGAQLLDVGCGYGRHAMELAARGFHVVGLDNSLPLLLRGADEAQRRGLSINFVHGDMRELTFESQFDAAYCLFSTFGYFDDETNKKTAQNIGRALKPGARFVVEVLNRDYLIQDLPTRVWWEGDGCVILEEVDFNYFSSRIVSNRSVVFDDGRQLEQEISIRAYSLHELGKLLHAAGFRVLEVSGSMNTRGRFFGAKARDIIVVAEKRATT
jgi:SAM-dependent methyltransferase